MQASDVIAITAIITSAIISITSSLIGFFNNRTNLQARRSEIALEKRLEAFREILEKMSNIKTLIFGGNESNARDTRLNLNMAMIAFFEAFNRNSFFLPPDIEENIRKFGLIAQKYINHYVYDKEKCAEYMKESVVYEKKIMEAMQKFVGYQ